MATSDNGPPAASGARGEPSLAARTEDALERAAAINRRVQAFLHLDREGALATARALDRQSPDCRGPLFGLPVAVKDNIAVRGLPSTSGSALLRDYRAPYDATVVTRLRQAGAIILGTANLDEFGMGSSTTRGFRGPTRNPVDPTRITGGSSGGPAAAVAAGAVPAALGTDTGGSVRQPAAHCGIFAIRPTYGRVSRYGITAYASSFDQVGCLATDLRVLGHVLSQIAGGDPRDATSVSREVPDFAAAAARPELPRRIVTVGDADLEVLDAPSQRAFRAAVGRFEEAGCEIRRIGLPNPESSVAAYYLLACAEASSNLSRFDGIRYGHRRAGQESLPTTFRESRTQGFGTEVRRRILLGTTVLSRGYRDAIYGAATEARRQITARVLSAFDHGALLLLPITKVAPRHLADPVPATADYDGDRFTILAALAGVPAIAVPAGERSGLPFGVELMAPPWNEAALFSAAAAFSAIPSAAARRSRSPSPGAAGVR